MRILPQPLQALGAYRQFIVYQLVPKPDRPGKTDKFPIDIARGRKADAHDPAIWQDFDTAAATAEAWGPQFGVGFSLTEADPFFFVDIDNCAVQGGNGWSEVANDLMRRLAGAAVEISQSGAGLHILGQYSDRPEHGCKNTPLGLELYTEARFVALTGRGAVGDASADLTAPLASVAAHYFPGTGGAGGADPENWTDGPVPEYGGPADDDELIEKARASGVTGATVFGNKASFNALWTADPAALGRAYPDNYGNRAYDASSADAALASHLAFWTGKDCERIDRLMRQSDLCRAKWDGHRSYLRRTISGAVSRCQAVYTGRAGGSPATSAQAGATGLSMAGPVTGGAEIVSGFQFLSAHQQVEYFAGCVYVQDAHRVFTPRGVLLKSEQFKATYGGYVFALDATNDKTTRNAWEAFTESQVVRYPIAEGQTFRPELPPGALIEEEGRTLVNTYTPAKVRRVQGDAGPFLRHLAKLLPDERDATILLSYMAACVQHLGVKFQWWPLLQGVEGNGKTLLTRCVAYAVGLQYSHFPKAEEVGSKFNSWLLRRLFIGVEDVYYPDHRREIFENLKPIITNDVQPIELKGIDQITARICANGMLNSNHKDAIRKTGNDRRIGVFFSAQQMAADIRRDGMGGDYFPALYNWLRGDGYAIVADYLATYPIPEEYNPATLCHRAPVTSTTEQALEHGVGRVEQEILEAIDESRAGFAGGWISSMALDRLLEELRMGRAIPHSKRREMLQGLGYDYHPALKNGRVNNAIPMDGGKPRLFIRDGHPDGGLLSPADVAGAYMKAQQEAGQDPIAAAFMAAG